MEENYTSERRSDNVDITALWRRLCKKWYFFAISVFACVVLVILYLQIAKPQYEVLADILVNEEKDSGGGGLASLMGSSGGGFSLSGMIGGGSVNDEMLVISSHTLVREVVQRLDLNKVYTSKKNFFNKKEYYQNSPLVVDIPESMLDTLVSGFVVKVQVNKSNNKIHVELKRDFFKTLLEQEATTFPIHIDYGEGLVIDTTAFFRPGKALKFTAHISGYDAKTELLEKKLEIGLSDKKANGILQQFVKISDVLIRQKFDFLFLRRRERFFDSNGIKTAAFCAAQPCGDIFKDS